jgi:hypothetical protein
MPIDLMALGLLPPQAKIATWLISQLMLRATPHVQRFLQDPSGAISRVGDLMVWQSGAGPQVIATLENLSDSQARVEQVVSRIETAQIGVTQGLGTLTSLSMASLGVLSLASGLMIWRMNALHQRLGRIGGQISDIQAQLQAEHQAHLQTSLDFLGKFEKQGAEKDLHTALEESTFATNLYRSLVNTEVAGKRRLVALNQCGRYYLLALTAQVRCLILSKDFTIAGERLADAKPTLASLAKTTFDEVLGKSPERFLDPRLQPDNVTLGLLTELYQQAHQVGAVDGAELKDASQVFDEHFRKKVYGAGGWFPAVGRAKAQLLIKLKYLMACIEEVGRIESLRLRIEETVKGRLSFQELALAVAEAKKQMAKTAGDMAAAPIVVFGLA